MPPAIDASIRKQVISQYLNGVGRNQIARDNAIGQGTVTNIIAEFKNGVQNTDYESVRELATHCKSEGIRSLSELAELVRLTNFIKRLGADEERVEQLISLCPALPDPQKIIEVVEKIGRINTDIPLEQLEEYIRQNQIELHRLQEEISEARATIGSLNYDRQAVQEYKELRAEMNNLQLKDLKKISKVFRSFKIYGCDGKKIIEVFADISKAKKQQLEIQRQAFDLEEKIKKYKDVLPLAGQIAELGIGFRELLAFHCAVFEIAEAQGIPPDTAAFKVVEEIKQYSELGGLLKQQEQVRQQIWMMNAFTADRNAAIMALCRLQLQGVTEKKILDIDTEWQHLNWARKKTLSEFGG